MSQREQFVTEWHSQRMSKTALCAVFGISRQTGYKWVRRYQEDRSLDEKSRRPHFHPKTTPKPSSAHRGVKATVSALGSRPDPCVSDWIPVEDLVLTPREPATNISEKPSLMSR